MGPHPSGRPGGAGLRLLRWIRRWGGGEKGEGTGSELSGAAGTGPMLTRAGRGAELMNERKMNGTFCPRAPEGSRGGGTGWEPTMGATKENVPHLRPTFSFRLGGGKRLGKHRAAMPAPNPEAAAQNPASQTPRGGAEARNPKPPMRGKRGGGVQEAKGRGKRCQSGVKGEAPPFLLPIGDVGTRYLLSMGRTEPPPHGDPPPPPQRLQVVGDKGRPWPGARSGVRGHSFGGGGG